MNLREIFKVLSEPVDKIGAPSIFNLVLGGNSMKYKLMGQKGFSIIELMIVVGIIGVLAGIGLPKMQVFLAKSKRTEAKTQLSRYKTFQEGYFADVGSYGNLGLIGFNTTGINTYYSFNNTNTASAYTGTSTNSPALCAGAVTETWTTSESTGIVGSAAANAAPTCS
jgi:prepilin-type N-terminal cleavage/methylation domain-containing protein